jgi:thioredoxin 1
MASAAHEYLRLDERDFMSTTVALTGDTFDEVIGSDKPTLVDFWADWCGPCKMIAPILEELAEEHGDRFTLAKVDVQAEPDLASRFEVQGIPLLILFQEGDILAKVVGARPKEELEATLLPLL